MSSCLKNNNKHHQYHEEGFYTQMTFREQALCLVDTISEMGNPFLDDSPDLLMPDTQNVVSESVASIQCAP